MFVLKLKNDVVIFNVDEQQITNLNGIERDTVSNFKPRRARSVFIRSEQFEIMTKCRASAKRKYAFEVIK